MTDGSATVRCKEHHRPYCVADRCRRAERESPHAGNAQDDATVYDATPTYGGYSESDSSTGDTSSHGGE